MGATAAQIPPTVLCRTPHAWQGKGIGVATGRAQHAHGHDRPKAMGLARTGMGSAPVGVVGDITHPVVSGPARTHRPQQFTEIRTKMSGEDVRSLASRVGYCGGDNDLTLSEVRSERLAGRIISVVHTLRGGPDAVAGTSDFRSGNIHYCRSLKTGVQPLGRHRWSDKRGAGARFGGVVNGRRSDCVSRLSFHRTKRDSTRIRG